MLDRYNIICSGVMIWLTRKNSFLCLYRVKMTARNVIKVMYKRASQCFLCLYFGSTYVAHLQSTYTHKAGGLADFKRDDDVILSPCVQCGIMKLLM